MPVKLIMPKIGLNMVEGQITEWVVKEGESVKKGDVMYVIETDKVANDVEAPQDGVLLKILVPVQKIVHVREIVGILVGQNEVVDLESVMKEFYDDRNQKEETKFKTDEIGKQSQKAATGGSIDEILASPLTKRLAAKNDIDLSDIKGSGPGGRIKMEDVEKLIREKGNGKKEDALPGKITPLARVRKIVAERMAFSTATMAMVTLNSELDVTSLVVYREVLKKVSRDKKEIPSYNAMLVFLTARVLKEFPYMNASFVNSGIKLIDVVNLGLAVDTSEGLMVVVVREADRKSIVQIHKDLNNLAERAQNQQSAPEDLEGSTFTITNLGMYGIDAFTPIINPPEAAILGVCRFIEKDVLIEGQNKRRTMANFSLTFDHRVIDGGPAARFLQRLGELIAKIEHTE